MGGRKGSPSNSANLEQSSNLDRPLQCGKWPLNVGFRWFRFWTETQRRWNFSRRLDKPQDIVALCQCNQCLSVIPAPPITSTHRWFICMKKSLFKICCILVFGVFWLLRGTKAICPALTNRWELLLAWFVFSLSDFCCSTTAEDFFE